MRTAKHQQCGRGTASLLHLNAPPALAHRLTIVREPRRLPAVFSVKEVTLLLQAAAGPKYKAAFATSYGAASGFPTPVRAAARESELQETDPGPRMPSIATNARL